MPKQYWCLITFAGPDGETAEEVVDILDVALDTMDIQASTRVWRPEILAREMSGYAEDDGYLDVQLVLKILGRDDMAYQQAVSGVSDRGEA